MRDENTCGGCRYFKVTREREHDRLGVCKLEKVMGVFRDSMHACPSYSVAGDPNPPVVVDTSRRRGAVARRSTSTEGWSGPSRISEQALSDAIGALDADGLKAALAEALKGALLLREDELGRGWDGGAFELCPRDASLKAKSIPIETLFHKIVMIRDNLRVLEQKVNSHAQLHDAEKVDVQRRINLAYDSVSRLGLGWVEGPGEDTAARLLERLAREVMIDALALGVPPLGDRWVGGEAVYQGPHRSIREPIERFFLRLSIVRDRLFALEALISAHPHIAPDEAEGMGGYLRRCYGTLTSFNVLFANRDDYFSSGK